LQKNRTASEPMSPPEPVMSAFLFMVISRRCSAMTLGQTGESLIGTALSREEYSTGRPRCQPSDTGLDWDP
jgi:hypothetical protein